MRSQASAFLWGLPRVCHGPYDADRRARGPAVAPSLLVQRRPAAPVSGEFIQIRRVDRAEAAPSIGHGRSPHKPCVGRRGPTKKADPCQVLLRPPTTPSAKALAGIRPRPRPSTSWRTPAPGSGHLNPPWGRSPLPVVLGAVPRSRARKSRPCAAVALPGDPSTVPRQPAGASARKRTRRRFLARRPAVAAAPAVQSGRVVSRARSQPAARRPALPTRRRRLAAPRPIPISLDLLTDAQHGASIQSPLNRLCFHF